MIESGNQGKAQAKIASAESDRPEVFAVLLASGLGTRIGTPTPKQFAVIGERTILEHSLAAFQRSSAVDHIILVIHPKFHREAENICRRAGFTKVIQILGGGATRFESSRIGACAVQDPSAYVLIHDVARPCVSQRIIEKCVEALSDYDAVSVAVPATDTIFVAPEGQVVEEIPARSSTYIVQTPQGFKARVIHTAHELAARNNAEPTDDCSLVVKYNLSNVHLVMGEYTNIKVTHPVDMILASAILAE